MALMSAGTWVQGKAARFNYDFWYQPYHDVMISTEWGAPRIWRRGFHPDDDKLPDAYGQNLNFYSWSKRELIQTIGRYLYIIYLLCKLTYTLNYQI